VSTLDEPAIMVGDEELERRLEPLDLTGVDPGLLPGWLAAMLEIREFEEATQPLAAAGRIPGGAHQAVGQEAVAVGIAATLTDADVVSGGHRAHHHVLAKGLPPSEVMAELLGRATGSAGGRGGTMHIADFDKGFFGSNAIVGAGVGVAMGAALAAQVRDSGQLAVGVVGDGGANTGRVWEAANMAAVWRLPLVIVCENNGYAVESSLRDTMASGSVADRAAGFGLHALQIDGQDVCTVYRTMRDARERALAGEGPTFVEAMTYRYHGHSTDGSFDPVPYRPQEEIDEWRRERDPILRLRRTMLAQNGFSAADFAAADAAARGVIEAAIAFAEQSPWPDVNTADHGVMGDELRISRFHKAMGD
jgi:pyruvate dehydrogenase E1 component alpha subunit